MKKSLRKLVIALGGFGLTIGISIDVMIHGWGLEPKNWWWIILGNSLGMLISAMIIELSKEEK